MDLDGLVAEVDGQLRARVVPGRAEHEKAYLKSGLQHYGVPVPAIRAVAKGVRKLNPDLSHDELIHVVEALWNAPVHERRMVAVELLDAYADRLVPADMVLLERLLRESRTWALVDGLAGSVVGPLVERAPTAAAVLDRWAVDDDFWIRRSALLALLESLRRGGGDFERFGKYADAMLMRRSSSSARRSVGCCATPRANARTWSLNGCCRVPRVHRA